MSSKKIDNLAKQNFSRCGRRHYYLQRRARPGCQCSSTKQNCAAGGLRKVHVHMAKHAHLLTERMSCAFPGSTRRLPANSSAEMVGVDTVTGVYLYIKLKNQNNPISLKKYGGIMKYSGLVAQRRIVLSFFQAV